jgi:hypothetical protein
VYRVTEFIVCKMPYQGLETKWRFPYLLWDSLRFQDRDPVECGWSDTALVVA